MNRITGSIHGSSDGWLLLSGDIPWAPPPAKGDIVAVDFEMAIVKALLGNQKKGESILASVAIVGMIVSRQYTQH